MCTYDRRTLKVILFRIQLHAMHVFMLVHEQSIKLYTHLRGIAIAEHGIYINCMHTQLEITYNC